MFGASHSPRLLKFRVGGFEVQLWATSGELQRLTFGIQCSSVSKIPEFGQCPEGWKHLSFGSSEKLIESGVSSPAASSVKGLSRRCCQDLEVEKLSFQVSGLLESILKTKIMVWEVHRFCIYPRYGGPQKKIMSFVSSWRSKNCPREWFQPSIIANTWHVIQTFPSCQKPNREMKTLREK